jgi:CO/xanthine dehydrogenase Mo-binding subunit
VQDDGRSRRAGQPRRVAHAHLGPVDHRRRAAEGCRTAATPSSSRVSTRAERKARSATRSRTFSWITPCATRRCPGLLARREQQPERHLPGMLLDELAQRGGQDPLEFRRKLLKDSPRAHATLNAVAPRRPLGSPALPACTAALPAHGLRSYVAACAEVSVRSRRAEDPPHSGATDCGTAVQSQQIRRAGGRLLRLRPVGALYGEIPEYGKVERGDSSPPKPRSCSK